MTAGLHHGAINRVDLKHRFNKFVNKKTVTIVPAYTVVHNM